MSDSRNENVGIAMALVVGAGASTGLGAAAVFFPSIVKLASRRVLAGSLGFSAGVMTYVSFIEIFQKSLGSFGDAGHEENKAYAYATLCFFSGVVVMMLLNVLVGMLLGESGHKHSHGPLDERDGQSSQSQGQDATTNDLLRPVCACCDKNPVETLERTHQMATELQGKRESKDEKENQDVDISDDFMDNMPLDNESGNEKDEDPTMNETLRDSENTPDKDEENRRLVKMGLNTAIAIGLHNFPEGLATFVAALNDPAVGTVLAVAIAIHNIPEGLCVALPIFYATGNRFNAFMWALLSGASEIVAALLGWAILANSFTDNTYAVLFGIVAGMMVIISVRELLPTAHFYDPEDTVVTYSYIGGMALIALSLVLFQL